MTAKDEKRVNVALPASVVVADSAGALDTIARQAVEIFDLKDRVADLEERISKATLHMVCIGGPLNDNVLQYSKQQLGTFFRILNELE